MSLLDKFRKKATPSPAKEPEGTELDGAIIEPTFGESELGAAPENEPATKGKRSKQVETAFEDTFVLGTQEFSKGGAKEILTFIRGKCADSVGSDFYYLYTFKNGVLKYMATKSKKHITGATTVFVRAFYEDGTFLYKYGRRYFMVKSSEDTLEWHMHMDLPTEPYIEVTDERVALPPKAPATIQFQWSLYKQHIVTEFVLCGVLLASLAFYGTTLTAFNAVQKKADDIKRQQTAATNAPKPITSTVDLAEILTSARSKIAPYDGRIYQIKIGKDGIVTALTFPNENVSRMFLERNGGSKYEDGKVLLGFNMSGGSSSVPASNGGEKQAGSGGAGKPANPQTGQPGAGQAGTGH